MFSYLYKYIICKQTCDVIFYSNRTHKQRKKHQAIVEVLRQSKTPCIWQLGPFNPLILTAFGKRITQIIFAVFEDEIQNWNTGNKMAQ